MLLLLIRFVSGLLVGRLGGEIGGSVSVWGRGYGGGGGVRQTIRKVAKDPLRKAMVKADGVVFPWVFEWSGCG